MTDTREYPQRPLIGVGGIVFQRDGALLLVQRAKEPARGRWTIPGGLVEVGETLEAAVVREVHEETGLMVEPVAQIEIVERIDREQAQGENAAGRVRYHYVLADYLCRVTGGELKAASDAADARWVPAAEWQQEDSGWLEGWTRSVLMKAWWRERNDGRGSVD